MSFLSDLPILTISVVSHEQGDLIRNLLSDIIKKVDISYEVILTLNVPEDELFFQEYEQLSLCVIRNSTPKGFAVNHNAAFKLARGKWFCVLNPDIRLLTNPFPQLLSCFSDKNVGVIGPQVHSPDGMLEDSVRRFPTPINLTKKLLGLSDGRYQLPNDLYYYSVDWIAGMFMLFRNDVYLRMGGFDEGFYLYYEDVDICVRLWKAGWKVLVCPTTIVIHDARHSSRHNLKYMRWHSISMIRFLVKHWLRLPTTDGF
jgi:GT2 family glycosyltransferase